MSRPAFVAACSVLGASVVLAAVPQAPAGPQAPMFRSSIDIVMLDATVVDRDGKPVRGLDARDFRVREDGRPQQVVSVSEVEIPPPDTNGAPWLRDAPQDVISNSLDGRRLVVIVLDDAASKYDTGQTKSVRDIAHAAVDELGPNDLASVVYTYLGPGEPFTSDRARLRAAIEGFTPHGVPETPLACMFRPGGCLFSTLRRIGDMLAGPPGRKIVILASQGATLNEQLLLGQGSLIGDDGLDDMFQSLQRANVTIYSFDPQGVGAIVLPGEIELSAMTGGRSTRGTNAPERMVDDAFRENGHYYLVGYRSSGGRADGRYRRTTMTVSRPGATVRTRTGYLAPLPQHPVAAGKPVKAAPKAIDVAALGSLPVTALPLRATAIAVATPGRRTASVIVTLAVRDPVPPRLTRMNDRSSARPSTFTVGTVVAAFDSEWKDRGAHTQTVEFTRRPGADSDAEYEVISRLPLAAGRYEIRIAAQVGERTGSAFTTIDVPEFSNDALSMSGIAVDASGTGSAPSLVNDLVPFAPTVVRSFSRESRVSAFVHIYQRAGHAPRPVNVAAQIANAQGAVVFDQPVTLPAELFAAPDGASHRLELPLASLAPGAYLLTLKATRETLTVERTVRFSVR